MNLQEYIISEDKILPSQRMSAIIDIFSKRLERLSLLHKHLLQKSNSLPEKTFSIIQENQIVIIDLIEILRNINESYTFNFAPNKHIMSTLRHLKKPYNNFPNNRNTIDSYTYEKAIQPSLNNLIEILNYFFEKGDKELEAVYTHYLTKHYDIPTEEYEHYIINNPLSRK